MVAGQLSGDTISGLRCYIHKIRNVKIGVTQRDTVIIITRKTAAAISIVVSRAGFDVHPIIDAMVNVHPSRDTFITSTFQNTFLIVVEATESQPQLTYMVSTLSDVLQQLVKDYWGQLVNVHIKPKKEVLGQYELIDEELHHVRTLSINDTLKSFVLPDFSMLVLAIFE